MVTRKQRQSGDFEAISSSNRIVIAYFGIKNVGGRIIYYYCKSGSLEYGMEYFFEKKVKYRRLSAEERSLEIIKLKIFKIINRDFFKNLDSL